MEASAKQQQATEGTTRQAVSNKSEDASSKAEGAAAGAQEGASSKAEDASSKAEGAAAGVLEGVSSKAEDASSKAGGAAAADSNDVLEVDGSEPVNGDVVVGDTSGQVDVAREAVELLAAGVEIRPVVDALQGDKAGAVQDEKAGAVQDEKAGAVQDEKAGAVQDEKAGAVQDEKAGAVQDEKATGGSSDARPPPPPPRAAAPAPAPAPSAQGTMKPPESIEQLRTAMKCTSMAKVMEATGRLQEALKLHLKSRDLREQAVGTEHPLYAESLSSLGLCLDSLGRTDVAVAMLQQCLEIEGKTLGERHPRYVTSMANLAGCHMTEGDCERALELYRRSETLGASVMSEPKGAGEEAQVEELEGEMPAGASSAAAGAHGGVTSATRHPDFLNIRLSKALCLFRMERRREAREQVQEVQEEVLEGRADPSRGSFVPLVRNVAVLQDRLGRPSQALQVLEHARGCIKAAWLAAREQGSSESEGQSLASSSSSSSEGKSKEVPVATGMGVGRKLGEGRLSESGAYRAVVELLVELKRKMKSETEAGHVTSAAQPKARALRVAVSGTGGAAAGAGPTGQVRVGVAGKHEPEHEHEPEKEEEEVPVGESKSSDAGDKEVVVQPSVTSAKGGSGKRGRRRGRRRRR